MSFLLKLFLFTLPMSYSFRLSPILTINVIFGVLIAIVYVFEVIIRQKKVIVYKQDIIFILFIFFLTVSIAINGVYQKTPNHYLSYIFIFSIYFFSIRNYILGLKSKYLHFIIYILMGVVFSELFSLLEFFIRNSNRSLLWIIDFFQNSTAVDYKPIFAGFIYRSRAFAIESGHYALCLNALVPICAGYLYYYSSKLKLLLFIVISILAYITTFSAGGIGSLLISLFMTSVIFFITSFKKERAKYLVLGITSIASLVILFVYFITSDNRLVSSLMSKILFKENSGRFIRWEIMLNNIENMDTIRLLFGYGVGYMSSVYDLDGTNLYLKLFVETGLIGLTLFSVLLISLFLKIQAINNNFRYFLLTAFNACVVQYFIISDYAYPWIWLVIIAILYSSSNKYFDSYSKLLSSK